MRASCRSTHSKLRGESALYHAHFRKALEPPDSYEPPPPFPVSPITEAKHCA